MSDILESARSWLADNPVGERMGRAHDARCHLRHLECLVNGLVEEIERLREERTTNEEREAIKLALSLEWPHTSEQWEALAGCVGPVCKVPAHKHKVAIRRFLARQPLPPGAEGDA